MDNSQIVHLTDLSPSRVPGPSELGEIQSTENGIEGKPYPGEVPATRAVDQETGQVMHDSPPTARPNGRAVDWL